MTSDKELLEQRLTLLKSDCEVCDRGLDRGICSCQGDLDEIDAIEQELRRRGVEFP
jgi:hypothetical protein